MHRKNLLRCGVALVLLVGCLGCSGKPKAKTVAAGGKVILEGAPVEGATVSFQPITSGGHRANGITGKDGSFRLSTFSSGDGVVPGNYKIVVQKKATATGDPGAMDPSKMGADYTKMMKGLTAGPKAKPATLGGGEVHLNYQTPERTPLTQTVGEDGDTNIVVPLKKDGT